jgi:ankyrin repeat protein
MLLARDSTDVNVATYAWHRTPLHAAVEGGHVGVVHLLLERDDININAVDCYGKTPLFTAADSGQEAIVQVLLARDTIDINLASKDGRTPLHVAALSRHDGVVRLLEEMGSHGKIHV